MKTVAVCSLLCLIAVPPSLASSGTGVPERASAALPAPQVPDDPANVAVHDALPLVFEPNVGQTHASTRYVARGRGYVAHVAYGQIDLKLSSGGGSGSTAKRPGEEVERSEGITERLTMSFAGARTSRLEAGELLESKSHYFTGRPDEWRTNVANYGSVRMKGVYGGIDVRLHGSANQLEYDFEVAPGADVSKIRVRFSGQMGLRASADGEIVLRMRGGDVRQQRAIAYQDRASGRVSVDAKWETRADGSVGIRVADFDRSRPLVIDPVILFVDAIGGSASDDTATDVAVDSAGAAYVAGETYSDNFPTTPGSLASVRPSLGRLSYVTKISPAGNTILYSTYLPGVEAIDDIEVDSTGALFIAGRAQSSFQCTPGAYDTSVVGGEPFVAKLSPSGATLAFATVIGQGSWSAMTLAVDSLGSAVIGGTAYAGETTPGNPAWPTTPGAFDTIYDNSDKSFVTKFSADGSALVFSTFLGPSEISYSQPNTFVDVDTLDRVVAGGVASAASFPTTLGAFDVSFEGGSEGYLLKLSTDGSSLLWSTFIGGGSIDSVSDLALDGGDIPSIAVKTASTLPADFPVTPGALDATPDTDSSYRPLAIVRFAADGSSLVYSTFFGSAVESASIAVGSAGDTYVAGRTFYADFPVTPGAFQPVSSDDYNVPEGFVSRIDSSGTLLTFSSFLGAPGGHGSGFYVEGCIDVAVDSMGAAFVVGMTRSTLFPQVNSISAPLDRPNAIIAKVAPTGAALQYSTLLGGDRGLPSDASFDTGEVANAVDVASDGSPIIGGSTYSLNFPVTPGSFDSTFTGDSSNAFVSKLTPSGSALLYSAFLGGPGDSSVTGLVIDIAGAVFVCGSTTSTAFPVTAGALDGSLIGTGADGFVAKISTTGATLLYSTYLGGGMEDSCARLSVDTSSRVTVTGTTASADFPLTPGAFDTSLSGASDAFVSRLSAAGTSLQFSTFLGGSGTEGGADVVVNSLGQPTVVGFTNSANFPTTIGAFDRSFGGDPLAADSFVTKLASDGLSLVYSTFLGPQSQATAVALDASGAACVTGWTFSPAFPSTPGAYDETFNQAAFCCRPDGYVLRLNVSGSALQYSSFIGAGAIDSPNPAGNFGEDLPSDIAIDGAGQITITGSTSSSAYPVTPGAADSTYSYVDAFLTTFNSSGTQLVYSTFLGGTNQDDGKALATDASGAFYVVGATTSGDFSTRAIGPVGSHQYSSSAFVAKSGAASGTADISVTNTESADPILTGTSLTYNLSVHNAGPDPALGSSVSLPIGSGMTFASCTVSQGTFNVPPVGQTGIVLASLGTVAVGQTATVAVVVTVVAQSGATLVTTATASTLSADSAPSNNIATETTGVIATPFAGSDTIGVIVGSTGAFFLKNTNAPGSADTVFTYGAGNPAWAALRGDWDGDGDDSVGLYDPATGAFFLRNTNAPGGADIVFTYGAGGLGLVPITGDWDGNGTDSIGLYAPSTGAFFLRNSNTPGGADIVLTFGAGGAGVVPLAGDWDGDGDDTIGLYLSASATFFLKNANAPGPADSAFSYGPAGLVPLAGDWDNNGFDTIGVFNPSTTAWFLRNSNTPGPADLVFTYGPAGAGALVGDWDGQ